jgi:hypothetical protein
MAVACEGGADGRRAVTEIVSNGLSDAEVGWVVCLLANNAQRHEIDSEACMGQVREVDGGVVVVMVVGRLASE